MKYTFAAAILGLASQAITLNSGVETKLAQTGAEAAAETEIASDAIACAQVDAEAEELDCDYDCDYYCPPALDRCPGVLQPPGPSTKALCSRPLRYCNNGYMHTDWNHNLCVDENTDECLCNETDY